MVSDQKPLAQDNGAAHVRHRDAIDELRCLASDLRRLASAANAVGNDGLSRRLDRIEEPMRAAIKLAEKAFADEFNGHFQTTLQGTSNMIGALMVMADKAREPQEVSK